MAAQPDSPTTPPVTPQNGATLREGRYRLRTKLGQGGMGSVYLAEDLLLPGRLVAIKENADSSADAQAQFKREALLLARLRHSNLPQVMDYFIEADGKQYLVMDYVPGDNLLELMRKRQGPLPAGEALAIVEQVMQALVYMHTWRDPDTGRTRPIIHRDIKPANIKRTPEGRVVLVDFGIAKVDSGTTTGTAVSAKALTPGYAPLEQYGGGTDARSDIYSLGATLYALLTGKAPPSATDMAMAADKQRAPLLAGLKKMPPAVAKVIERAMQSLPKDRYQSIAEMYQALCGRPLTAATVSQTPPARQGMAGSRRLGWIVGALGVILAVGLGWLLFAQSGELPGTPVAVLPTTPPNTPTSPPATTPAVRATTGQSALGAEPATSTPTPEPSDTATPAPTETPSETPSATASATPVPTATVTPRPTATSTPRPTATPTHTPRPTVTRTPTPRPTATVDATATAIELEVQRRLAATHTALAPTKTATLTRTPHPTATSTPRPTATATRAPIAIVTQGSLSVSTIGTDWSHTLALTGRYEVSDDLVIVYADSMRILHEMVTSRLSPERLLSISAGLATFIDNQGTWDIVNKSTPFVIDAPTEPGKDFNFQDIAFTIDRSDTKDIRDRWLVFEITLEFLIDSREVQGTTYAHSNNDIFQGVRPRK